MYLVFKRIIVANGELFSWEEVCRTDRLHYVSQLAEGIARVDKWGGYRYTSAGSMLLEVVRHGGGKYSHVIVEG